MCECQTRFEMVAIVTRNVWRQESEMASGKVGSESNVKFGYGDEGYNRLSKRVKLEGGRMGVSVCYNGIVS